MRHLEQVCCFEDGADCLEIEVVLVVVFFEFLEDLTGGLTG